MNLRTTQRPLKKITKVRLKNIALYYLKRFESSEQNLKDVLKRRVDRYAFQNKDFDPNEALLWIDEIIEEFKQKNYVSDKRFAEIKIEHYLNAGKPKRYISNKLKAKGIDEQTISDLFECKEIDEKTNALNFAKKKKIGPFRTDPQTRKENRQKDMGTLLRAGFDYEIVCDIIGSNFD